MKEMEDRPPPTYEEAVTSQPQSSYPTPLISPSSQAEISDPSETQGISKDTNCNYTDSQPQCYIPQEISDIEKRKRMFPVLQSEEYVDSQPQSHNEATSNKWEERAIRCGDCIHDTQFTQECCEALCMLLCCCLGLKNDSD
ncbi:unnamed protein product [Bursaphelenchus xylophilus]|uniref:(pine wood nematode) hypothetical protein n=1 Tax=Bursaphelenchus xylophilus TaxID=6326 RepID=A0A7I8X771_BURXY|nr:unnamed protein product [Bursaphelenchus xylophilus]CAG9126553.1 unnamed protein product [Bursaphelenchus xylophilus]